MPDSSVSYIGEISMFGYSYAPRDWYFCNGALIPIAQDQALYALLGIQFGGDGRFQFGLLNMNSRAPIGAALSGSAPGLTPYAMGAMPGQQTRTLYTVNLPGHTHDAVFTPIERPVDSGMIVKSGGGRFIHTGGG